MTFLIRLQLLLNRVLLLKLHCLSKVTNAKWWLPSHLGKIYLLFFGYLFIVLFIYIILPLYNNSIILFLPFVLIIFLSLSLSKNVLSCSQGYILLEYYIFLILRFDQILSILKYENLIHSNFPFEFINLSSRDVT